MAYISNRENVERLMQEQGIDRETAIMQDAMQHSDEFGEVQVVGEQGEVLMVITIDPPFRRKGRG